MNDSLRALGSSPPGSFAAVFVSPGRGHRDRQRGSQTGGRVRKHRAAPSGARITVAPWQLGRLRAPLAAARPAFRTVRGMSSAPASRTGGMSICGPRTRARTGPRWSTRSNRTPSSSRLPLFTAGRDSVHGPHPGRPFIAPAGRAARRSSAGTRSTPPRRRRPHARMVPDIRRGAGSAGRPPLRR